mmetsp:Transcript_44758/g.117387  ORF Transcript_44758/g.117387 Transcript_44758/m.117387 type:complete len:234 (-) Transcript_44758:93-794(-)
MIEADRAAIAAETLHASLSILEREMVITLNFMGNIANTATLLAELVFAYVGVWSDPAPIWPRQVSMSEFRGGTVMQGFILCFSVASFCLLMYSVLIATLAASLAPNKAFKDREHASMRTAVEDLKEDSNRVVRAYHAGLSIFACVVPMQVWISMRDPHVDYPVFIFSAVVFGCIVVAVVVAMRDMHAKYGLSTHPKPSGLVTASKFLDMADAVHSNSQTIAAPPNPNAGIKHE